MDDQDFAQVPPTNPTLPVENPIVQPVQPQTPLPSPKSFLSNKITLLVIAVLIIIFAFGGTYFVLNLKNKAATIVSQATTTSTSTHPTSNDISKNKIALESFFIDQIEGGGSQAGKLSIIRSRKDAEPEKLISIDTQQWADYYHNFSKISPDKKKIYILNEGIYNIDTRQLAPFRIDRAGKQDCVWFSNSEKIACLYIKGFLSDAFYKISIFNLKGEEELITSQTGDNKNSGNYFHYSLVPIGIRNDSEIIFRVNNESAFINFTLNTKKFGVIYETKDNETSGEYFTHDRAVYSTPLDKLIFIQEIKEEAAHKNLYTGRLVALDLKNNLEKEIYTTGTGTGSRSPSHLVISLDKTKVAFQLYIGEYPNEKYQVVIADLTNNEVKVVDFPALEKEKLLEYPSFKGFSNDPDYLLFFAKYGNFSESYVEFKPTLLSYNIQTKELNKIISCAYKTTKEELQKKAKSSIDNSCNIYDFKIAQSW